MLIAGDVEVLMDLGSYSHTAICTQKTDVLVLEMRQYERLLVKRNPRTIDFMKESLELKLKSRFTKHVALHIPFSRYLVDWAVDYNQRLRQQMEAKKQPVKTEKEIELPYGFVPPRGCIVDQYAPGTVFYKIRMRDRARHMQNRRVAFNGVAQYRGMANAQFPVEDTSNVLRRDATQQPNGDNSFQAVNFYGDPSTSDRALTQLEERIRTWLSKSESNTRSSKPRVAKLQRSDTQVILQNIVPLLTLYWDPNNTFYNVYC